MREFELDNSNPLLLELVQQAVGGEPFIIRRDGKALVQVMALPAVELPATRRLGGMEGQFVIPDDFDTMCADEIEELFYGRR